METIDIPLENLAVPIFIVHKGRQLNQKSYLILKSNVFNIPEQLETINKGYFVVLNRYSGKYEIHNSENKGATYCLTVPYEELDGRTIDLVLRTRSENAAKLIAEMEANNEKLEKDRKNSFVNDIGELSKDIFKYAQKSGDDTRIDGPGGLMF